MKIKKLTGMSGKDNTFVMIETAAKVDLEGILKATTASEFTQQRFLLLEKLWRRMNEVEKGGDAAQSGVQYIIDLDGLQLSTNLYSMVTGWFCHCRDFLLKALQDNIANSGQ